MTAILVNSEFFGGTFMADYQKIYAVLCNAIDKVIDPLDRIPLAAPQCKELRAALLQAEEIYIRTDSQPLEGTIHVLP